MSAEIELGNGQQFRVTKGQWTALDANEADPIMAEIFDEICHHSEHCNSVTEPDRDYCYAALVVHKFGGKITYKEPPDEYPPGTVF